MGTMLTGLISGLGEQAQQQQLRKTAQSVERQRVTLDFLKTLANAPGADPRMAQDYMRMYGELSATEPGKLDKAIDKLDISAPMMGFEQRKVVAKRKHAQMQKAAQIFRQGPSIGAEMYPKLPTPPDLLAIDPRRAIATDVSAEKQVTRARGEVQQELADEQRKRHLEQVRSAPWFAELSPREQAQVEQRISLSTPYMRQRNVYGTVSGAHLPMDRDSLGNPIDRSGGTVYRLSKNADGSISSVIPVTENEKRGRWIIDKSSSTGYSEVLTDPRGNITQVRRNLLPPASLIPSISQGFQVTTDAAGNIVKVPVTRSTGKDVSGMKGPPQLQGQSGAAPYPAPPGTSPPTAKTAGGKEIIGHRPLSDTAKKNRANASSGLQAIRKLRAFIKKDPKILVKAALPGKLGARQFQAVLNEASDVVTRLRTGAALNMNEEKFYRSQFPSLLDLTEPAAIEEKLSMYEALFSEIRDNWREDYILKTSEAAEADPLTSMSDEELLQGLSGK